jgi:hypothetical protein
LGVCVLCARTAHGASGNMASNKTAFVRRIDIGSK